MLMMLSFSYSFADSKIKDIVDFEGVRENMLVGYGLISGLDGTGDNLQNASFTQKGLGSAPQTSDQKRVKKRDYFLL